MAVLSEFLALCNNCCPKGNRGPAKVTAGHERELAVKVVSETTGTCTCDQCNQTFEVERVHPSYE